MSPVAPPPIQAGRVLVKPQAGADLGPVHAALGAVVRSVFPAIGNLQVIELPPGVSVATALATYRGSGRADYAEPDYLLQALRTPDDPHYLNGDLWNMFNEGLNGGVPGADIHAAQGWDVQYSAANIILAVVDTGVRYTHEDLAANVWVNPSPGTDGYSNDVHGINAIAHTGDPNDDYGHGTHVAGIAGALGNNGLGVVGVAWQLQIMACKFLDSQGQGTISDAITCLDYARSKGAKIVNASWGGYTFTSTALHDAIASLRAAGIIFVAACGNDDNNNDVNPLYPASYTDLDNVVAVAATDQTDSKAAFSNYGRTTVALAAPGMDVLSCWRFDDSDYEIDRGTSMATPHVAGACALVWAHHPNFTYRQVIQCVVANTDPLPSLAGRCVSGGRLNLYKALTGAPPPSPVTASFTANPTSGQPPLTVQFTDTSNGTVTAWDWNFGDGTAHSTVQNPGHTYMNAGTFDATLTVTASGGGTSSASQTITVTNAQTSQLPVITLLSYQPNAYEQGTVPGVIRFHRTGDPSQSYEVYWTFSGTAANGVDFQQLPTHSPFPAGASDADLTITPIDQAAGDGDKTVTVTLAPGSAYQMGSPDSQTVTIHDAPAPPPPAPGTLAVNPTSGFAARGSLGGPFQPNSQTYTLTNSGGTALNWGAHSDANWLSLSSSGGALPPGAQTSVRVTINTMADLLFPGTYSGTVSFDNTTNGRGNTSRTVTLWVR